MNAESKQKTTRHFSQFAAYLVNILTSASGTFPECVIAYATKPDLAGGIEIWIKMSNFFGSEASFAAVQQLRLL